MRSSVTIKAVALSHTHNNNRYDVQVTREQLEQALKDIDAPEPFTGGERVRISVNDDTRYIVIKPMFWPALSAGYCVDGNVIWAVNMKTGHAVLFSDMGEGRMTNDFLYWGIVYFKFATVGIIVSTVVSVMVSVAKFIVESNKP